MTRLDTLLGRMHAAFASDLHLKVGWAPRYRIHGDLLKIDKEPALGHQELEELILAILSPVQRERFADRRELDFTHSLGGLEGERFRCCAFQEQLGLAAVFRRIPADVPTLRELEIPESVETFAHRRSGLLLVTGATGSGKSSTLAALVDVINEQYRRHVITLEDPIEFVHAPKQSIVHQRGLHYDLVDFPSGIRAALREDPDVLLVGEMRDLDTMRLALTAAEIGALVLATLHTNGAVETVDRIVEVFPADEQPLVRSILSHAMAGVVSQVLLRRVDRPGRVVATEVLVATPAVANLIREGKTQDLVTVLQTGRALGMHTLDDSLEALVARGVVDVEEAGHYASNKARFQRRAAEPLAKAR